MLRIITLSLLLLSGCGCPHRFYPSCDPDPIEPICVPECVRVALVLGSGGVRGMAHVGVMEVLIEAGLPIDLIVGCSAGSFVGALYADNPHIEEIKQAVWRMKSDSVFDIDIWNCRYGLSQGKTMNRIFDDYLEAETFEELKVPLVVVASDLNSGELVPIGCGELVKAVQASCSIPFFFVPCEYGGRVLVDGGVVNPVPVKVARDLGAEIVIAVDLAELLPRTFPSNLFEVATRSAEIAFMWQNQVCTNGADLVIRPKTCDVGTFNDKMKLMIYNAGRDAAEEQLPKIRQLVASLADCDPCQKPRTRQVNLQPYTSQLYRDYYTEEH
jgi:NTE family protein